MSEPDRIADWDTLSEWLGAWLAATASERARLRAALGAEHPHLAAEADALTGASSRMLGFLETPAMVLAAQELAANERLDPLLAPGSQLGPYRVDNLLAIGGMGHVYRAIDLRLQRAVALKVLSESRSSDPRRVDRFMQEARVTAALDHPNVVRVYDVGTADGRAYLVAELLEGETMRSRIGRGPIPSAEALRIAIEVTGGLAAAHAAGLVHRDLKPENIFLTKTGTTKILDFGVAKLTQDETVRDGMSTLTGVVLGTAGYLAPEQIRGEHVDARADLFALGAVLFEMLTGVRAFAREHLVDTLHAIVHDPVPCDLADRTDVPPSLREVVMRLLEKAASDRFQSSRDVIVALEGVDPSQREGDADRLRRRWRTALWNGRRRIAVVLGAALLAAAAAGWRWLLVSPPVPSAVTLAVIPFESIPAGVSTDRLELGLADSFISRLSRLPEIRVLPLTATERLRDRGDPGPQAARLGATHVLFGRLQRDNGFVRATVQLVATADNHTIWSSPVDTDSSSLFAIQDIVVTRVLEELAPRLTAGARRTLVQAGTRSSAAYEAYLRGRAYVWRPTMPELTRAASFFERAVQLDPGYADAWAGLASAAKRMPLFDAAPSQAFVTAKSAATRARELDPRNGEALSVLGTVAFWYEWDYPKAETLLRESLEIQPESADSYLTLAHLFSNLGRHDEALVEIRRARALDPAYPAPRSLEGQFLFMARRYDDALVRLTEMVAVEPRFPAGHIMRVYPLLALHRYAEAIAECDTALELNRRLDPAATPHSFTVALRGYALARMNRTADAEQVLAQLRRQAKHQYVPPHHEALLLHALGDDDEALVRLREAVDVRDLFVTFAAVDPKWDELRGAPAFRALMSRVNLLEVSDRARR